MGAVWTNANKGGGDMKDNKFNKEENYRGQWAESIDEAPLSFLVLDSSRYPNLE